MAELKKNFPQGVDYRIVYDPTIFVRDSIHEVVKTLFEATLLVVIVVVLFLQTWRASIIPLVAVPISIVGTFAVLLAFGFSINTLSLFGLVLAIGIVVDDAIVVVENVERNIEAGLSPRDAAHKAMDEVSGPIIAIALVLCAVFVPVAFISGLTGQFYRQFALTIAFSTLISAFNSLTLSPALSAILLKPHGAPPDRLTRMLDRRARLDLPAVQPRLRAGLQRLRQRRGTGDPRAAAWRWRCTPGCVALTAFGFTKVPHGFVPTQDKQYLVAFAQLPDAATLDRTEAVIREMSDIGLKQPGVANAVQFPGLSINGFVNAPNAGIVFFTAQAVRGAARPRRTYGLAHRRRAQPEVRRHPGRLRRGLPAAAGARARHGGRVQAGARGPRRAGRGGAVPGHPGAARARRTRPRSSPGCSPASRSTCPSSSSMSTGTR